MSEFEKKWQVGARRAREAKAEPAYESPLGFASRVVVRARTSSATAMPLEQIWTRFSLRALACVAAAAITIIAYEARTSPDAESLLPEVEAVPAQLPWMP